MQAWRAHRRGPPDEVLVREDVPVPTPSASQVLIAVVLTGVSFPGDLVLRGQRW